MDSESPAPSPRSSATAPDLGAEPARAEFGVLFVHGIGDAAEGDTLLSFGEPLLDWMRERMAGANAGPLASAPAPHRGRLQVLEATLQTPRGSDDIPAHAQVRFEPGGSSAPARPQHWLFAEAWWAGIVRAPAPARLLAWMLSRIPLMVLWHLHAGQAGRLDTASMFTRSIGVWQFLVMCWRMGGLFALLALMAGSALLALALQVATLVALAVIWIPIGRWRRAVLDALRLLTLTLGDSYVLLEQDFQRAALAERVRKALRWMSERCAKVMVVAHSQGGAVAHEALKTADLSRVDSFVTVGSGLEKLEFLRLVRQRRAGLLAATWAGPCVAGAIGMPLSHALGWVDGAPYWWVAPSLVLGYAALICLMSLLMGMKSYRADLEHESHTWPLADGARRIAWYDVYASLDLVPQGARSQLKGLDQQRRVANEWSLVFDHIRYFQTRCGFASWLWRVMDKRSSLGAIDGDEAAALARLERWHSARGLALSAGAWAAPAGVGLAVLLMPNLLTSLGQAFIGLLGNADMRLAQRALLWASQTVAALWTWLPAALSGATPTADRAAVVAGTLPLAGVVLAWWLISLAGWRHANDTLWRRVCAGRSHLTRPSSLWAAAFWGGGPVLGWAIWGMVPLWASAVLPWSDRAPGLSAIGVIAGALLAGLLVLAGASAAAANPWIVKLMEDQFDFGRVTKPVLIALYAAIAASFGFCGVMLWEALYGRSYLNETWALLAVAGALGWLTWGIRKRAKP